MATYLDLHGLYDNAALRRKVEVALLVRAQSYLDAAEPNPATTEQRAWARHVFQNPSAETRAMLRYLLARHRGLTVTQLVGADGNSGVSDQSIQDAVDAVAAQFVSAFTGT